MKLICSKPYPVPKLDKQMFKKEVEFLVLLVVLENSNDSEWGNPLFAQPKHKTNLAYFLSEFRNLNKQLKHKLYPMPKIN